MFDEPHAILHADISTDSQAFQLTDGSSSLQSQYIREMGLAGGMVWALDLDDFRNRCGQGAHPLMNTIKAVLGPPKGAGDASVTGTVAPPPVPVPENTTPMSRVPTPTQPESVQPSGAYQSVSRILYTLNGCKTDTVYHFLSSKANIYNVFDSYMAARHEVLEHLAFHPNSP